MRIQVSGEKLLKEAGFYLDHAQQQQLQHRCQLQPGPALPSFQSDIFSAVLAMEWEASQRGGAQSYK